MCGKLIGLVLIPAFAGGCYPTVSVNPSGGEVPRIVAPTRNVAFEVVFDPVNLAQESERKYVITAFSNWDMWVELISRKPVPDDLLAEAGECIVIEVIADWRRKSVYPRGELGWHPDGAGTDLIDVSEPTVAWNNRLEVTVRTKPTARVREAAMKGQLLIVPVFARWYRTGFL